MPLSAPGAVVTPNVPPLAIVSGNPAVIVDYEGTRAEGYGPVVAAPAQPSIRLSTSALYWTEAVFTPLANQLSAAILSRRFCSEVVSSVYRISRNLSEKSAIRKLH